MTNRIVTPRAAHCAARSYHPGRFEGGNQANDGGECRDRRVLHRFDDGGPT